MRRDGAEKNDIDRIQAWAGQSAWMAREEPAGDFLHRIWRDAQSLIP
jgi:nitronate monooxygenase